MPVAITHFSITELPDPNAIISLVNGGAIIVDTLYPIADESTLSFERTSSFDNKALNTFFKYKTHDNVNNITSNEALGNLEWSGVTLPPSSNNILQVINNLDVKNLLTTLPLNDSVETIKILSLEGVQNLTVRGLPTNVGQILNLLDLYYADFTALLEGGGIPYFKMTYQVGRDNVYEATVYELQFDISTSANLVISDGPDVEVYSEEFDEGGIINEYVVNEQTIELEVNSGQIFGTAQVEISINSAYLLINNFNQIEIDYGSDSIEETNSVIHNIELELDVLGKADFSITNYIVKTTAGANIGLITITLKSINNEIGLVNGSQIVNFNTNL